MARFPLRGLMLATLGALLTACEPGYEVVLSNRTGEDIIVRYSLKHDQPYKLEIAKNSSLQVGWYDLGNTKHLVAAFSRSDQLLFCQVYVGRMQLLGVPVIPIERGKTNC